MTHKLIMRLVVVCLSLVLVCSEVSTALAASYYNQDVTAYVAKPGALTASGKTPAALDVAVHQSAFLPIWNNHFTHDTRLVVDRYGNTSSTFNVQDMGTGPGLSQYWFDIYFGVNTTANTNAAIAFGKQKVPYYTTH